MRLPGAHVRVDHPADLFAPAGVDASGAEFTAASVPGARFALQSEPTVGFSIDEGLAQDVLDLGDGDAKKTARPDGWEILARRDATIVLRRVLISPDGLRLHRLDVEYPAAEADAFGPIAARIAASLAAEPVAGQPPGTPKPMSAVSDTPPTPSTSPAPPADGPHGRTASADDGRRAALRDPGGTAGRRRADRHPHPRAAACGGSASARLRTRRLDEVLESEPSILILIGAGRVEPPFLCVGRGLVVCPLDEQHARETEAIKSRDPLETRAGARNEADTTAAATGGGSPSPARVDGSGRRPNGNEYRCPSAERFFVTSPRAGGRGGVRRSD